MNIRILKLAGPGAAVMLLSACANQAQVSEPAPVSVLHPTTITPQTATPVAPPVVNHVRSRILAHYADWRGTPHRWGGLTRDGVDCSGYILNTYRDLFELQLPRTTRAQVKLGQGIKRSQLRDGDLVFFKIGPNRRHAGIYVGNGQFAHASYSKGVTISSLDNVYWKPRYWKSRRVL